MSGDVYLEWWHLVKNHFPNSERKVCFSPELIMPYGVNKMTQQCKWEAGKSYKTVGGMKATIGAIDQNADNTCQIIGWIDGDTEEWSINGYWRYGRTTNPFNLTTEEWKEPVKHKVTLHVYLKRNGEIKTLTHRFMDHESFLNDHCCTAYAVFEHEITEGEGLEVLS